MKRYWSDTRTADNSHRTPEWLAADHALDSAAIQAMQTIDADCNDCRHFKRGLMTRRGQHVEFAGQCMRFHCPTTAYPMQFTGHKCFEHRKS